MPRYTSLADLRAAYGDDEIRSLTDRAGDGAIDQAVADDALDAAEAKAEGYLRGRHSLPLPRAPRQLKDVILRLARERLDPTPSDDTMREADDARKTLREIRAGTVLLDLDDEPRPAASLPAARAATSRFNQDAMGGYGGFRG